MRTDVSGLRKGIGPFKQWQPLPVVRWQITGTTKNASGTAIGGVSVDLFATNNDAVADRTISDTVSVGAYSFSVGLSQQYYAVAYLAGSPDTAGTTVNTLVGVEG